MNDDQPDNGTIRRTVYWRNGPEVAVWSNDDGLAIDWPASGPTTVSVQRDSETLHLSVVKSPPPDDRRFAWMPVTLIQQPVGGRSPVLGRPSVAPHLTGQLTRRSGRILLELPDIIKTEAP